MYPPLPPQMQMMVNTSSAVKGRPSVPLVGFVHVALVVYWVSTPPPSRTETRPLSEPIAVPASVAVCPVGVPPKIAPTIALNPLVTLDSAVDAFDAAVEAVDDALDAVDAVPSRLVTSAPIDPTLIPDNSDVKFDSAVDAFVDAVEAVELADPNDVNCACKAVNTFANVCPVEPDVPAAPSLMLFSNV